MATDDHKQPFLEEDAEEALSLCDLPLQDHHPSMDSPPPPPPATSSSDFFEFFIGSSEMCPAEDVIFCGKLVPFKDHNSPPHPPPAGADKLDNRKNALRKRSESLSELQSRNMMARSDSAATAKIMMRNSRSLDCRKLQRSPEVGRNCSGKSVDGFDKKAVTKPRWYLLMFGMVKLPPEMELRDIKSRQYRRSPAVLFPPADTATSKNFHISSAGKSSWGFLRALSCKDYTSVAATTPFKHMPQA